MHISWPIVNFHISLLNIRFTGNIDYTYKKIKELSEDEDHTYFFIIDASISESIIEKNPALKYLPFFP